MNLFGGVIQNLEKSLNYSAVKNHTISNNIANVDTPHYKAKDVSFKTFLNQETQKSIPAKRTHENHFSFNVNNQTDYHIKEQKNTQFNHNGNNVDIDKEMSELAQNQIYYQALVDRLNGKFRDIQTVVREGG